MGRKNASSTCERRITCVGASASTSAANHGPSSPASARASPTIANDRLGGASFGSDSG